MRTRARHTMDRHHSTLLARMVCVSAVASGFAGVADFADVAGMVDAAYLLVLGGRCWLLGRR